MTRSGVRNFSFLILLAMTAVVGLLWWQIQQTQLQLQSLNATLEGKRAEFANLSMLTKAQDKLDALTLDERASTQLDILRYLGLEQMNFAFSVDARESQAVGDAELIVRTVSLKVQQAYGDVLPLIDKLFGTGKLQITSIQLMRGDELVPEDVNLTMQAKLYSLAKRGPTPERHVP
jgi:hypothetical protein